MVRIGDIEVPDVCTCWTIQRADAWAKAARRGVFRVDGRQWPPEYRWFRDRLVERVPRSGRRYPVWASLERQDLRGSGWQERGAQCVRVEFRVPQECALLVDREAVFAVLNRGLFAWSEKEYNAFHRRNGKWSTFSDLDVAQQRAVEQSWHRGLELRRPKGSRVWCGNLEVDVLVPEVRIADVVRVTGFVAR